MTTINLRQEQDREDLLRETGKMNSSLVFFLVVFGILVVAYGGLKLGSSYIEGKSNEISYQVTSENQDLNGKKDVDEVIDLQFRLNETKKNIVKKIELTDVLDNVSKSVIPGVVFSSYSNADKKISVALRSSSFDSISRQVFNFKHSDYVANVVVKSLTRDEKGIKCEVEMSIK